MLKKEKRDLRLLSDDDLEETRLDGVAGHTRLDNPLLVLLGSNSLPELNERKLPDLDARGNQEKDQLHVRSRPTPMTRRPLLSSPPHPNLTAPPACTSGLGRIFRLTAPFGLVEAISKRAGTHCGLT